jgi:hypothetical protein
MLSSEWMLGAFLVGGLIRLLEERIRRAQVIAAATIRFTREESAEIEKMLEVAPWRGRLAVTTSLLLTLVAPRTGLALARRQLAAWRELRAD